MLETQRDERGFLYATFLDRYDAPCSIQESSLASEPALWLGCDTGTHHAGRCMARMHLTQAQAANLIPLLQYFVENGSLPVSQTSPAVAYRASGVESAPRE